MIMEVYECDGLKSARISKQPAWLPMQFGPILTRMAKVDLILVGEFIAGHLFQE